MELHDTGPGGTYARLADLGNMVRFREDLRARIPEPGEVTAPTRPQASPVIEVSAPPTRASGSRSKDSKMVA